jgi:hypothetical protein
MRRRQNIPPVPDSGCAYVTVHTAKSVLQEIMNFLKLRELEPKVDLFLDSVGANSIKELSFSSIELALLSENKIMLNILHAGKFSCLFNYHTKKECDLLRNNYYNHKTKKVYENSGLYIPAGQDEFQYSVAILNKLGMKCCDTCRGIVHFEDGSHLLG